jgi:hypothetical protein
MFFIDVPYKSIQKCTDNKTATNDFDIGHFPLNKGMIQDCTWTEPKELSPVHDAVINITAICGGVFIILSAYAFLLRKKEQDLTKKP